MIPAGSVAVDGTSRTAVLSPCGRYRYRLEHRWNRELPTIGFVMLNPSTADEHSDDATIRRCGGFARRWGFGALVVTNLFALRATNPQVLLDVVAAGGDPVGPDNPDHLRSLAGLDMVVLAWGARAGSVLGDAHPQQTAEALAARAAALFCLGRCRDGAPRHPLYVAASTPLTPWSNR